MANTRDSVSWAIQTPQILWKIHGVRISWWSTVLKHSCWIYCFQICVIFIQICTSQRLHIPPHSTGAGACDQFNLVQSNIVLCMVLLQHQWKKRWTSDYLLLMLRTWQDTYFLAEIQKKHEELTKKEESLAKVNEKLSSFFAVHLQKGISIVNVLFYFKPIPC